MVSEEILGVVLAGGQSRRMGVDKADALVAGASLRDRALSVLDRVFRRVVLSVAVHEGEGEAEPKRPGRITIVDRHRDRGPLAALEAALTAADGIPVFVLACDLPVVDEQIVRRIVSRAEGREGQKAAIAWVASADGRVQPLCGLYSPECLAHVRARLESGSFSMQGLLDAIEVIEVGLDDLGSDRLLNVNRPADLARARNAVDV